MKKDNRNQHETTEFKIEAIEARILGLRGRYREEAMVAYRKLLGTSRDRPMYLARY